MEEDIEDKRKEEEEKKLIELVSVVGLTLVICQKWHRNKV